MDELDAFRHSLLINPERGDNISLYCKFQGDLRSNETKHFNLHQF